MLSSKVPQTVIPAKAGIQYFCNTESFEFLLYVVTPAKAGVQMIPGASRGCKGEQNQPSLVRFNQFLGGAASSHQSHPPWRGSVPILTLPLDGRGLDEGDVAMKSGS